jgi:hypothetical protein
MRFVKVLELLYGYVYLRIYRTDTTLVPLGMYVPTISRRIAVRCQLDDHPVDSKYVQPS